jgi:hypothetical protein
MATRERSPITKTLIGVLLLLLMLAIIAAVCALFYFVIGNFFWYMGSYHWDKFGQHISGFEKFRRLIYAGFFFLIAVSAKIAAVVGFAIGVLTMVRDGIDDARGKKKAPPRSIASRVSPDLYDQVVDEMKKEEAAPAEQTSGTRQ